MRIPRLPKKCFVELVVVCATVAAGLPGQAQQEPLRLRLNVGTVSLNKLVNWVAYEEGLYKKNGLDVQQGMSRDGAAEAQIWSGFRSGVGVRRAISGARNGRAVGAAAGACPVPEAISVTMESPSSSS